MMAIFKYVVVVDNALTMMANDKWPKGGQIFGSIPGREYPIVFPYELVHAVMVEQLQKIYPGMQVISGGFTALTEDGFLCFGRSTSLGVKSRRGEDDSLLDEMQTPLNDALDAQDRADALEKED